MSIVTKSATVCTILLLSGCASPDKRIADEAPTDTTTSATSAGSTASQHHNTSAGVKTTKVQDSISVALAFINDYIKHLDAENPFDEMNWVENNELATDEFKASYKEIIAEGLRNEPEMGLSYDPIINAQDYPVAFEFVRIEENEFIVVRGTDQPQFTNVLRARFVVDRWLVDGSGVVNIPEEKRMLK